MSEFSKTFDAKLVSVHVGKTIEFIKFFVKLRQK